MENKIAKIYRIISIVILGLCIYGFLLPLISPVMEKILPGIWVCPFLRIVGHDCPFCGITRGLSSIYHFEFEKASLISMFVFLLAIIEVAYRTIVVLIVKEIKQKTTNILISIDVLWHTLIVVLISVYVIMFLVNNF